MNYGFVLEGGDIPVLPEIAAEAEPAGRAGRFIADERFLRGRIILIR